MSVYAPDRAGAYADILEAGFAVEFTKTVYVPHPTDGTSTRSVSTVEGAVVIVPASVGDARAYEAEGLVLRDVLTLLYANEDGELPAVGATCEINDVLHTVRALPMILQPDGSVIIARIGVTR